ncbi:MAG: hypothetical protein HYU64_08185 [Armatimonadetes bacterium]|nr:hypothetical protein [Armatimonadota bacterium]
MNTRICRTAWASILLFFMACGLSPLRAEESSLAVILSLSGSVELHSKATPQSRKKASLMRLLYAGDRLLLADTAEVTVKFLSDGRREKAKGKGEVTITAQGCKSKGPTLQKGEGLVKLTALRDKQSVGDQLGTRLERDGGKELMLAATLNPSFSWKGEGGEVLLSLFQGPFIFGAQETLIWKKRITGNAYVYPKEAPPLEWGQRYYWKVLPVPMRPDEVIKSEEFRTAKNLAVARQLTLVRDRVANAIKAHDIDSLTEMVTLFMDNECYNEALPPLKELEALRPEDPAVHYLLAIAYNKLGEHILFKQEKEKVKEHAGNDDTYKFVEQ